MERRKDDNLKLLLKDDMNWDLYDNGNFVVAVAKFGTGSSNSQFGDYDHFRNYINNSRKIDKLTDHGEKIYHEK